MYVLRYRMELFPQPHIAPAIEICPLWSHLACQLPFWYFALELSNNIISYDWSNFDYRNTKKPNAKIPGNSFSIFNKPFSFDTCFMCFSLLCLFIRSFQLFYECLEEFMMVHYLNIIFGWIVSAHLNTTFKNIFIHVKFFTNRLVLLHCL